VGFQQAFGEGDEGEEEGVLVVIVGWLGARVDGLVVGWMMEVWGVVGWDIRVGTDHRMRGTDGRDGKDGNRRVSPRNHSHHPLHAQTRFSQEVRRSVIVNKHAMHR
jgi:hypothetical protein